MDAELLEALRGVIDPEVGYNVVDLGLVYQADREGASIRVALTMTTPTCPLGDMIVRHADAAVRRKFPDARDVKIELVWEPPWSPSLMSTELRRTLGWEHA